MTSGAEIGKHTPLYEGLLDRQNVLQDGKRSTNIVAAGFYRDRVGPFYARALPAVRRSGAVAFSTFS
jgi:hypothetical protein